MLSGAGLYETCKENFLRALQEVLSDPPRAFAVIFTPIR
jgi:hypothetical protein